MKVKQGFLFATYFNESVSMLNLMKKLKSILKFDFDLEGRTIFMSYSVTLRKFNFHEFLFFPHKNVKSRKVKKTSKTNWWKCLKSTHCLCLETLHWQITSHYHVIFSARYDRQFTNGFNDCTGKIITNNIIYLNWFWQTFKRSWVRVQRQFKNVIAKSLTIWNLKMN